jgi:HEAT repeat protein
MEPETARALLSRDDPRLREVAVRYGGEAVRSAELRNLAIGDPDPGVRAAALTALVGRLELGALEDALVALGDPDPLVQATAAQALARWPDQAVPRLRETLLAGRRTPQELRPVAMTLALSGVEGASVLEEVAKTHEDPQLRALARLALGRLDADEHTN